MKRIYFKFKDPSLYKQPIKGFVILLIFLKKILKEFLSDNCFIRASGLAYSSLLAIVPLLAFLFSLFTAFGSFREIKATIETFLINQLVPTKQEDLLAYLNTFIDNSKTLGVLGLLLFAITSISLLDSINSNFNALWGSPSRKNFISKFTTYTSVIVAGSLLISVSFNLSNFLKNLIPLAEEVKTPFLEQIFARLSPTLFMFIAILLMIILIPQGKVQIKSALLGAASGALLWEFIRFWFLYLTNVVFRFSVIYGSIAVIPIFLFWLYLTWMIILMSLEITYVHQHKQKFWTGGKITERKPAEQILFGLELYCTLAWKFLQGLPPASITDLSKEFAVVDKDAAFFINLFLQEGLLYQIKEETQGWIPSRPLEQILVKEVITAIYGPVVPDNHAKSSIKKTLYRFNQGGQKALEGLTIKDLMDRSF